MIAKSESLVNFVQKNEESGLNLGVFPTRKGDRYAIRAVDPDDPSIGLGFVASFSSNLREADRPKTAAARKATSDKLNAILHDPKASAKFSACYCVIDADSVAQFGYSPDELGKTFTIISACGTAVSDSYREASEEKATRNVSKD